MFYIELTFVCATCRRTETRKVMLKVDGTPDFTDLPAGWITRLYNHSYPVPYCPDHAAQAP